MKINCFVCCVLFALWCVTGARAEPPAGYSLAWSDAFEGGTLNTNKWAYRTDSKHWSTQLPKNVTVAGDKLSLSGRKEEANGKHYTGAGIISRQSFKYGYYEASLKLPSVVGWHTSFWLMKHDGSGGTAPDASLQEIDVCENDSIQPNSYYVNTHRLSPPHKSAFFKIVAKPKLAADYHVYGCEFTPATIKYFFDDKEVGGHDATTFPHSEQHIWLTSIASYLGHTKLVDDKHLPAIVECDWVRFYEKK